MNATEKKTPVYLKDYSPPAYLIPKIDLHFTLGEEKTLVRSKLYLQRHPSYSKKKNLPCRLNGVNLKLLRLRLQGKELTPKEYVLDAESLTLPKPPPEFELEVETEIEPHKNYALEGLYKTGKIFCTQNESEGFRKITYFLDRPDILSRYTTVITADKKKYPVLLSNGNFKSGGDLPDGLHEAVWEDPFPKPCYLFALVAGDLACVKGEHVTGSGRKIDLRIYVDPGNENKCDHAMKSLQRAMRWDEKVFGLECDLDQYMIVAVNDFNFGAMENKGLNIFNAQYVLADPKTATDANFLAIESVIGHEYFHNWTGNRVTCRDWFQITLKEGLTIFRDQEFSADLNSRTVKRIEDVRHLRDYQFPEDAGPQAHPIRPESYLEINNFYTSTVYQKGAEVIRMIAAVIGKEKFLLGIKKYFELYDGKAVTTEDFVRAMELASGTDLTQFKIWYGQAGTPQCAIESAYDEKEKLYRLTFRQSPPSIQKGKGKPFFFPCALGLLDLDGKDLPLEPAEPVSVSPVILAKEEETITFQNIRSRPVPSFFRGFSAPVHWEYPYSDDELMFLLTHDSDHFNRYEAGQRLAAGYLGRLIKARQNERDFFVDNGIVDAFGKIIYDESLDPAFKAECLVLPSLISLLEKMKVYDFEAVSPAREWFVKLLADAHQHKFFDLYHCYHRTKETETKSEAIGKRALKNRALGYLAALNRDEVFELALKQLETAENMTDEFSALSLLCYYENKLKPEAVRIFRERWKDNPLVMNKWFAAQASSKSVTVLENVQALEKDPAFDIRNPNKIRSLIGVFTHNLIPFHAPSGRGYAYLAAKILEIDPFNPSAAAHLALAFNSYQKLDAERQKKMRGELEKISTKKGLSGHTMEIVSKILGKA